MREHFFFSFLCQRQWWFVTTVFFLCVRICLLFLRRGFNVHCSLYSWRKGAWKFEFHEKVFNFQQFQKVFEYFFQIKKFLTSSSVKIFWIRVFWIFFFSLKSWSNFSSKGVAFANSTPVARRIVFGYTHESCREI